MKWFVSAALLLCLTFAFPAQGLPPPEMTAKQKRELTQKEEQKLHGQWRFAKATLGATELTHVPLEASHLLRIHFGVDGSYFHTSVAGKVKDGGAVELNPTPRLKRITLNGIVGIYSLDGERLVIAFNAVDARIPPDNFSGRGTFEMIWHLERIKKAE